MNKVILIGRLTKDVEISAMPSGANVSKFTVAVDRRYQKQGEERKADFLNIVAFGKTAEFCCKWFSKGQMISIVGSIQTRSWDGQDGKKRYATEIIAEEVGFCGGKTEESKPEEKQAEKAYDVIPELTNLLDDDETPF